MSDSEKPQIFIDTREKTHKLAQMLEKQYRVTYMVLQAGDYLIPKKQGYILIEKATYTDFLGKVRDGRIWNQINGMKALTDHFYLLLENPWMLKKFTNWNEKSAMALEGAVLEAGCPIFKSQQTMQSLFFMQYLINKYSDENRDVSKFEVRYKPKEMTLEQQSVYLLTGITGIGESTAVKLLEKFGTLGELSYAKLEDIESVVNVKVAKRIQEVFHYCYSGHKPTIQTQ